jgi:hypothetical protein
VFSILVPADFAADESSELIEFRGTGILLPLDEFPAAGGA